MPLVLCMSINFKSSLQSKWRRRGGGENELSLIRLIENDTQTGHGR